MNAVTELFNQIDALINDTDAINFIGDKTFHQYKLQLELFVYSDGKIKKPIVSFRGHSMSLIQFYCDTVNGRSISPPEATIKCNVDDSTIIERLDAIEQFLKLGN